MPTVASPSSDFDSGNEGYYYRKSKPFVKDPSIIFVGGLPYSTSDDAASVDRVLNEHEREPIVLNRKKIDPKRGIPEKITARRTKKLFVGGISSDTSQDEVYYYFKDFRNIVEAMLIFDKSTNKHKGFGFVTYDKYDTVDEICYQQFHFINGKKRDSFVRLSFITTTSLISPNLERCRDC
ncbi:RNA-binding protein Musashi-like protein [Oopsacas minuta]|uniref:RNA-binding protein Musashi-like protein n=1 Tax=Oopsacas minuta TaxID=111878 RepID=A0AAV7KH17_9METZ|nr:RNA-binding protein Musashi-like protein [Oopsacas minuta]